MFYLYTCSILILLFSLVLILLMSGGYSATDFMELYCVNDLHPKQMVFPFTALYYSIQYPLG
jgi:hypothetical protein